MPTSADLAALNTGLKATGFLDSIDETIGDFDEVKAGATDLPPGATGKVFTQDDPANVDPRLKAGVVDEPPVDEPPADEPPVDEPVADEPTADEPAAESDPFEGQSAADRKWGDLRAKLAEATKKQIPALQTELERIKREADEWKKKAESASTPSDYDEIKKGYAEAQTQLKITKLEATDAFKKAVTVPLRQINEQVTGIAARNEVTPETLRAILEEKDEAKQTEMLNELTGLLNRRDETRLFDMVDARNTVRARETVLREDVDATIKHIEAEQKILADKRAAELAEENAGALEKAFTQLESEVPALLKKNGNPDWDVRIDAIRERAKNYKLDELTPLEQKRVAVALGAYPHVMEFLQAVCQENESLKASAKARTAAAPSVRQGSAKPAPPPTGKPGGFLDAMDSKLGTRNA